MRLANTYEKMENVLTEYLDWGDAIVRHDEF